jgi:hypothetical protein
VKLAVIAMGDAAEIEFLSELAQPDGVRRGSDAAELSRAFESELARGRVRENGPIHALAAPNTSATSIGAELASALRGANLPSLSRSLRARARDGDELVLLDDQGAALLGIRRAGAGLTATFASSPDGEWAPAWRGDVSALGPLLRALARTRQENPRPRARIESGRLSVRGVPHDWPVMLDARAFDIAAAAPADAIGSAHLSMPGNGVAVDPRGVREGPWTGAGVAEGRSAELQLTAADGWRATLPLAMPCAAAFEWPQRRVGGFGETAAGGAAQAVQRPQPHAAAPWLLGLGITLLLAAGVLGATRT